MIQIKSKGPPGLCGHCHHGSYATNSKGETYVECGYFNRAVNAEIIECAQFTARMSMSRSEMEHMAWIIDTKPGIGFIKPGTTRHKELEQKEPWE